MKHIASILIIIATACAAAADEYHVTGLNLITGERVCGQMDDVDGNGTVTGMILDRTMTLRTIGQWSGAGQAILVSEEPAVAYKVEVVE